MCDDAAYFLGHIDEQLRDLGLEGVKASGIARVQRSWLRPEHGQRAK